MRFLVPLFVFLAVAAFHTALSASLESAEKEEKVAPYDGLSELQKIDQMEFEAAQKNSAAQMNVTEEQNKDSRYLEAAQDGSVKEHVEAEGGNAAEGGGNSDAAAHEESSSESSEETEGRQGRDQMEFEAAHKDSAAQMNDHHEAAAETVSSLDEVSQDEVSQDEASQESDVNV